MFFPHILTFKPKDLVLEIGPGAYPHWRADCLADIFEPGEDVDLGQFGGLQMKTLGKPLFKITNGKLPFKDQSFDYIICSHVFEHVPVQDLPLMISEIERVGKKYYIEFPTAIYDYIYDFSVHTNFMDIVNGEIICLSKSVTEINKMKSFTSFLYNLRTSQNAGFERNYPQLFACGSEFTGKIPYKIIDSPELFFNAIAKKYTEKIPNGKPPRLFEAFNKLKKIVRPFFGEKQPEYFYPLLLNQ